MPVILSTNQKTPYFTTVNNRISLTGNEELDKQLSNHSSDYFLIREDLEKAPQLQLVVPQLEKPTDAWEMGVIYPNIKKANAQQPNTTEDEAYGVVQLPEFTVTPQGTYGGERTIRKAVPVKNIQLVKAGDISNKKMRVDTGNGIFTVDQLDPNYEVYLDENGNPVTKDEIRVANYMANRDTTPLSFTEQMENLFTISKDNPVFGQRRVDNYRNASKSNYDYMENVWGSTASNLMELTNLAGAGVPNWLSPTTWVGAAGQLLNGEDVTYFGNRGLFELTPGMKQFYDEHPWLGNIANAVGAVALPKVVGTATGAIKQTPTIFRNIKAGAQNWIEGQPRMNLNGELINPGEYVAGPKETGTVGYQVTSTRNGGYKGHVGRRHGSQMSTGNHYVRNGNGSVTGEGMVAESSAPKGRVKGTSEVWNPQLRPTEDVQIVAPFIPYQPFTTNPPTNPPTEEPEPIPQPEYRYEDYKADPFIEWYAKQPGGTVQYYSGSEGHPAGPYKIERDPNYKGGYTVIRRVGDETGAVIPDSTTYARRETFMDMPKGNPVYRLDDGAVPDEAQRSETEKIDIDRAKVKGVYKAAKRAADSKK